MASNWKVSVVGKVVPSPKESKEAVAFASGIAKRIKKAAPKNASVEITGSIAKGTFLRGEFDVDVFVFFPPSVKKGEFEKRITALCSKAFRKEKKEIGYAEHPYVRVWVEGIRVDVVPAYKLKDARKILSAVDRSIFHTKFVKRKLPRSKVRDVLLLKKLLKANRLYGAEIRVKGFSGYLAELLIIRYKGFDQLMRALSKWKTPVRLTLTKEGDPAIFNEPLVFVDPVDPNRNVAAAVSPENLAKLVSLAKGFGRKKSPAMFLRDPRADMEARKRRIMTGLRISCQKPAVVDDILWGQLHRLDSQLASHLKSKGFTVKSSVVDCNHHVEILLSLDRLVSGGKAELKGPPLEYEGDVVRFEEKHSGAEIVRKGGRIYASVEKPFISASDAVSDFLSSELVPSYLRGKRFTVEEIK